MKAKWVAVFLFALAVAGCSSVASDDDLQETFEGIIAQLNAKNVSGFLAGWDSSAVVYVRNQPFPIDRLEVGEDVWTNLFSEILSPESQVSYILVDVNYRVVGDVGTVWGLTQISYVRGAEQTNQDVRLTASLVKIPTGWKIVSWHDSAVPEPRRATN